MIVVEWGTVLQATLCFLFLECIVFNRKNLYHLFQNFIFFTEVSCEYVKNDHVLFIYLQYFKRVKHI